MSEQPAGYGTSASPGRRMGERTATDIINPNGNTQVHSEAFTKTDAPTASIGGFTLQRDPTYTIANEWLDVPDNIAALPDLQGYGNVYDLHQAMARERL